MSLLHRQGESCSVLPSPEKKTRWTRSYLTVSTSERDFPVWMAETRGLMQALLSEESGTAGSFNHSYDHGLLESSLTAFCQLPSG